MIFGSTAWLSGAQAADDSLSATDKEASAIAKAAAINRMSIQTGVRAGRHRHHQRRDHRFDYHHQRGCLADSSCGCNQPDRRADRGEGDRYRKFKPWHSPGSSRWPQHRPVAHHTDSGFDRSEGRSANGHILAGIGSRWAGPDQRLAPGGWTRTMARNGGFGRIGVRTFGCRLHERSTAGIWMESTEMQ